MINLCVITLLARSQFERARLLRSRPARPVRRVSSRTQVGAPWERSRRRRGPRRRGTPRPRPPREMRAPPDSVAGPLPRRSTRSGPPTPTRAGTRRRHRAGPRGLRAPSGRFQTPPPPRPRRGPRTGPRGLRAPSGRFPTPGGCADRADRRPSGIRSPGATPDEPKPFPSRTTPSRRTSRSGRATRLETPSSRSGRAARLETPSSNPRSRGASPRGGRRDQSEYRRGQSGGCRDPRRGGGVDVDGDRIGA